MISEIQIRYGSRVRRQGKSRLLVWYQISKRRRRAPAIEIANSRAIICMSYDAFVKLSRVIWLIILVLILGAVAYAYFPPFRYFTLFVAGRSPICPLEQ